MSDPKLAQAWDLHSDGHHHRVEVHGRYARRVTWTVDGVLVARTRSYDETVRLRAGAGLADDAAAQVSDDLGQVAVRFTHLGRPRLATLHRGEGADLASLTGSGGLDLHPEPGSRAARHDERLLAHPRRYAATQAAIAVAMLVVPLLVAWLVARLAVAIPWPDLPSIPWPSIPWPDLPSIPWPDLPSITWPDWSLPGWVSWVLDKAGYVWPVVLAYLLATSEVRRRRRQAEQRAAQQQAQPHAQQETQPQSQGGPAAAGPGTD